MSDNRPLRVCDVCGQVDTDPRHVFGTSGLVPNQGHVLAVIARDDLTAEDRARIVADILDTTTQYRHPDCCASVGCPDEGLDSDCAHLAATGLTGPALLAFIQGE
jgi:hypothetical protein